uniref:Uncharacterized protein n=1 Tax=Salvator merianae TaxID=96440 RepID=A0A8D0BDV4_SALMN
GRKYSQEGQIRSESFPLPTRSTLTSHLFLAGSADKIPKKKKIIPKIIVTGPSEEFLTPSIIDELPETRTIRDSEDYGAYNVHTKPSTVDAYKNSRDQ